LAFAGATATPESFANGALGMTSIEDHQLSHDASIAGRKPDDRFLWGYLLFAVCSAIILATFMHLDIPLVLTLYLFALVALVTIVGLLTGTAALFGRKFKRAAALLIAPFIIAAPFLFPLDLPEYRPFDLLRFYFTRGQYDAVIDKLPPAERPTKVVFFDWNVTGFLDQVSYYWLVYDESGEIALPDEERSQAWKDNVYPAHHLVDPHCLTSTQHMSGHYYIVVMHCAGA
jgi:hypothetical protein